MSDDTIEKYKLGAAPDGWTALLDHLHREGVSPQMAMAAGLARQRKSGRGAYDLFRGRIIIPIEDARGRIVAFGGRVMPGSEADRGDAPKYVNSPETDIYKKSHTLYGLAQARSAVQRNGRLLVVEGYFDVLSLTRRVSRRPSRPAAPPSLASTCGRFVRSPSVSTRSSIWTRRDSGRP